MWWPSFIKGKVRSGMRYGQLFLPISKDFSVQISGSNLYILGLRINI